MFRKGTILSLSLAIAAAILVRHLKNINRPRAPVVEISTGKLEGVISTSRDGRAIYEYLNIPFAKPPVGELRFEPPEPPEPWSEVRDASEYGPKCLQVDLFFRTIEGEEDCLQLNLFSPISPGDNVEIQKLPVMVWFHGGLFIFGSGVMYRPEYFLDHAVILVTVNYRLGSLGFLNTGDIRGNMGLKDQNMALRWIQSNIAQFGRDPSSVTIFGESAGGASAHFHQLSPASRGLFHKIISQSGISSMPWALNTSPEKQASRFIEQLNCSRTEPHQTLRCLKDLPAHQIASVHMETTDPLRDLESVFVPTIEKNIPDGKTFLAENPRKLLETGAFSKVPFMGGILENEGIINSAVIYRNETVISLLRKDWNKWIPRLLYLPEDTEQEILTKIREYYIKNLLDNEVQSFEEFENVTHMFTDRFWNLNFHNGIRHHVTYSTKSSPVFLYYYSYPSDFSLTNIILALKGKTHPIAEVLISTVKSWIDSTIFGEKVPKYGVCHGDELSMQFYLPVPLMPFIPAGHADYEFSKELVKLWCDFARSDPREFNLTFMGTAWTPQTTSDKVLSYLKLDKRAEMIAEPFGERVEFWKGVIDSWYP